MAAWQFVMAAMVAVVAGAKPKSTEGFEAVSGSSKSCVGGKVHSLQYSTYGPASDSFIDLDTMDEIEDVKCDVDHTRLYLTFHSEVTAAEYLVRFHDWNDHYLVGGTRWNCTVKSSQPGLIVRRVIGASMPGAPSKYIDVQAADARYDEIYSEADLSFSTQGACDEGTFEPEADHRVCVGFNTDCVSGATASLPIFQNKYVTVACSDCYIDFTLDVFFDITIHDFTVQNISLGYKDVAVNGSAVVTANAQANWNTGVDKTLQAIQTTYLVNFKIGPVPFMIFFELPVEVTGSFTFTSSALVQFGASLNWGLDGSILRWDPENHWRHELTSTPSISYTPVLSTSASLNAEATFAVIPTLRAHFDHILTYSLTATPTLDATITGSEASKQVCMDATYDVNVKGLCELDINIPWANIAKDWQWNQNVYDSGTQTIAQKCLPL
mmetsp:Transcript_23788/g.62215  ORF Transcript_23788/g.62215 Transcript_23788/m.62215 type:complete len:439 (-) Transcript_23788:1601-2917(-)|eukprot:CAMPEP_0182917912 /NCGR_PEP_ID=MMETSP0105_2-20130417/1769_1 /TAXON_ID=81532 ORGANISM="Acanthoeca-like sp., Strain 10tr" /NCGR_SAMPLE_ID=MMETSP0105_2 /ASSEMBLY_ACC=CAM_ASM_000205 /LENGTH=438 /DNA_ID=CAMNT_0025054935 /DNA_START=31 /DNA_END=1347 /DNA_ORIENTATION=-